MLNKKRILAVVPARGGSKGVPLKNIQPVGTVPLVAWVGRLVKEIPMIDRAVVSTDNAEIAKIAEESGLDAPFMRPDELSGDRVADWPVLNHALETMESLDGVTYEIIVMLQPTSPLRKKRHVTATIEKLEYGGFDAVWTVSETDSKSHPLKQLVINGDQLDYYDPAGSKIIARQQLTPVYHRNGAAYAISRDCLANKKSIKGDNTSFVVIDEELVSIDTPFDFEFVEYMLKRSAH